MSAKTPEGRVKTYVNKLLTRTADLWYFMPVPSGYGIATLDYIGCHRGAFFAIETKIPGKDLTPRQQETVRKMRAAGAEVFVVKGGPGDPGYEELALWLSRAP